MTQEEKVNRAVAITNWNRAIERAAEIASSSNADDVADKIRGLLTDSTRAVFAGDLEMAAIAQGVGLVLER